MIDLQRVRYSYPQAGRPALQEVTLQVGQGELVLVGGRSGSGKSTLLGTVNALVPHFYGGRFGGHAVIAGRDTRQARPHDLAEIVGTAFQEPASRFITRSVRDEIAFGLEVAGLPASEIGRRVTETVERLHLGSLLGRPLAHLSGGEQQRVAVAAALIREPSALVLDEPTSQLDAASAEAVLTWLTDLSRRLGLTTLISEHRIGRLLPLVDRVAHLSADGRLQHWGPPREVLPDLRRGPVLAEAQRRLGLSVSLEEGALAVLKQRLLTTPSAPPKAPSSKVRLACRGVRFGFPDGFSLKEVELEVAEGQALALLGPNGSGKTTVLRCLMGLLPLEGGEVTFDGLPIQDQSVPQRARSIAYVPQWPSTFLFAETVREELEATLRNHGMEAAPPVEPDQLLERFGLSAVAERYPRDLSSGERQRTALAAILVTRPRAILMDEPTLGMDPEAQDELAGLIEDWKGEGMSVAIATHDVEFAASVADRAVVLEQGRVIGVGPTPDVLFEHKGLQTALQRLSGCPRPAGLHDLPARAGDGNANS